MKTKLILPALTEAKSKFFRPIKYSLFPPLGLATLAGYLRDDDEIEIVDEHVEKISTDDTPDLVAIEVYITNAWRAYEIADIYRRKGVHVVMGGLHVTTMPHEALRHADTIIVGPAEEAWLRFLEDFRNKKPYRLYHSKWRSLKDLPPIRRDLIKTKNYLVPNSLTISRGCPHHCNFCYKDSFFQNGKSYYHYPLDQALDEISSLSGKHLFFLDDNLFADTNFTRALFQQMRPMGRIWQAAATVQALRDESMVKLAAESGCRSLFIGFENLSQTSLNKHNKTHNQILDYDFIIRMLHDYGIMINGSFIFGLPDDDPTVFDKTVQWALDHAIETATFHILTPYPGTYLYHKLDTAGQIVTRDWSLYDTRHLVFNHPTMNRQQIEEGYMGAYEKFYRWSSIVQSICRQDTAYRSLRHLAYSAAWKKCEPIWNLVIRAKKLNLVTPLLEKVLNGWSKKEAPYSELEKTSMGRVQPVIEEKQPSPFA